MLSRGQLPGKFFPPFCNARLSERHKFRTGEGENVDFFPLLLISPYLFLCVVVSAFVAVSLCPYVAVSFTLCRCRCVFYAVSLSLYFFLGALFSVSLSLSFFSQCLFSVSFSVPLSFRLWSFVFMHLGLVHFCALVLPF
ncbi:hypothetical protein GGI42DRAFT_321493 [Trichoderma sp. SZMC 28013]